MMPKGEDTAIPVKVALRCRPLLPKEIADGCQMCLSFVPGEPQVILGSNKCFTYDYVFDPSTEQEEVFNVAIAPLMDGIFSGYNATVLAYGQTGSGKTYSMGGAYTCEQESDPMMGAIPRVIMLLFQEMKQREEWQFTVKVSYLEIYNEDILDLLATGKSKPSQISIREDSKGSIKIVGLTEHRVTNAHETVLCLEQGNNSRTVASTAMNTQSSRSHAIFTMIVEQKQKANQDLCYLSKLHLVDLAGSERQKKTKAEGDRLREGISINKGLLCLGNVISALGDEAKRGTFVPYRDSKLTRLLQDSLGGNSHTLMIACVSPADYNMEETLNTLRYADRARKIKNKPIVNVDPQAVVIQQLREQVQELQVLLLQAQGETQSLSFQGKATGCFSDLRDKNNSLEEENEKLSRGLSEAAGQIAQLLERVIVIEQQNERINLKLEEIREHAVLQLDLPTLLSSVEDKELKEQLEGFLQIQEIITQFLEENLPAGADVGLKEGAASPMSPVDVEMTPESSDEYAAQHALQQAQLSKELLELNKALQLKEVLARKICQSSRQMEPLECESRINVQNLEEEVAKLQKEKEELFQALQMAKTDVSQAKVSERRRKRLQDLEKELTELRNKLKNQSKLLKLKESSERSISKLNLDIQTMKSQRVHLIREMKEDAEKFRRWKQQTNKEVIQLKAQDRKRQNELVRMERDFRKQAMVFRRKTEEAVAANKRLKDALHKQQEAIIKRKGFQKERVEEMTARVKNCLENEIEVLVSAEEAQLHVNELLEERKNLANDINMMKEKHKAGEVVPPKIRRRTFSYRSMEMNESTAKEIEDLQAEMELRNAQISDLQQKVLDAKTCDYTNQRWQNIAMLSETMCAINYLIGEVVAAKVQNVKAEKAMDENKATCTDLNKTLEELQKRLEEAEAEYKRQVAQVEEDFQEKLVCVLQQKEAIEKRMQSLISSKDQELEGRVQFQKEQQEHIEALAKDSQDFCRNVQGLQKQKAGAKRKSTEEVFAEPDDSVEEEEEGETSTPAEMTHRKKRGFWCICQGMCKNTYCCCWSQKEPCITDCKCNTRICFNRNREIWLTTSTEEVTEDDDDRIVSVEDPTQVISGKTFFQPPVASGTTKTMEDTEQPGTSSDFPGSKPALFPPLQRLGEDETTEPTGKKRRMRLLGSTTAYLGYTTPSDYSTEED
ncbi:chromosome-associated kinesin KIF4-like isoform X2 [Erythrolamprus reginae]|uniref:chromosome-associated kinesin KIF4-like isoform X2 n=1 Tax=Erythrolamprus reginae TaxID=121349 RepID=UPI00396C3831